MKTVKQIDTMPYQSLTVASNSPLNEPFMHVRSYQNDPYKGGGRNANAPDSFEIRDPIKGRGTE